MDYKEEQQGEIEALQSIYEGDLEVVEDTPYHIITMPIRTDTYDPDSNDATGLYVLLRISHTAKYPEELPELDFDESDNLEEEDLKELRAHLASVMEESLGMVMIFTVISSTIEWLGNKWEEIKSREEEAARQKRELLDAEEKRKLEGTKVTIESFLAWKTQFEAEFVKKKVARDPTKPTGKEMFLNNAALNESDIEFLAATGDQVVEVDEALFENLDDLDLEDEDEDDPDWTPGNE